MKPEQAIRILHPDTTREALAEIEYYGGFNGDKAVMQAINDACLMACKALEQQMRMRERAKEERGEVD